MFMNKTILILSPPEFDIIQKKTNSVKKKNKITKTKISKLQLDNIFILNCIIYFLRI